MLRHFSKPLDATSETDLVPSIAPNPFTVGDGGPTKYRVGLTLNGKTVDEAFMNVSFQR